ncbi:MAG: hypothetical protein KC619_10100, partial [Myxococcales bacterium]|nr:hypothetical protein [Myxococcales bacterium]
ETDVDCGGPTTCPRCADYAACDAATDCTTGACTMGRCGTTGCVPFPGGATDSFGYFGCSLTPTTLPCPDISTTGTALTLDDDDAVAIPIGFPFDYYGTTRTMVTLSANGGLVFDDTYLSFSNECFPLSATPYEIIAGLWTDLYPPDGGTVRYETRGAAPNRQLVVRWNVQHIDLSPSGMLSDVTVVLHESGDIDACYANTTFGDPFVDGGAAATAGISGSGTNHLQFSCNTNSLPNGLLLLYRHP